MAPCNHNENPADAIPRGWVPVRVRATNPYSINDLTVGLLETNPHEYLRVLENLMVSEEITEIKKKLNDKPYESWHSNHVFSLSRLVGKMNQGAIDEGFEIGSYYGSRNQDGIPFDLACSLLKKMLNCGADIMAKDYYENSIIDYLSHPEYNHFSRTDNEEFKRVVEGIYYASVEEGIPPEH